MSGPVLTPAVLREDHALHRFMLDRARGIFPDSEIATRWGFADDREMRRWELDHPRIVEEIARLRTLNESDEAVLERVEHKYAHILDQGSGTMAAMVSDPTVGADSKIKIMQLAAELSGAKAKMAPKAAQIGDGRAPFVINFNFRTAPPEKVELTPTVVEAKAIEVDSE